MTKKSVAKQEPRRSIAGHVVHHAKHWFIPHAGNNHQPHALRPRALRFYAYLILAAKISSVVFLFAAYPNQAEYSAYTASTILSLSNQSRQEKKIGTLTFNPKLAEAATRKAKDMLARNYFAHTTPDGKRFWTWIDNTGYNYSVAGENLAIDFTSPESAHAALMASPSHRENILNTRYKEVGIAVVTGEMDGVETTVLVEMFGTQVAQKTQVAKVTTVKPKPKPTTPALPTTKPTVKPTTTKPEVRAEQVTPPKGNVIQQSSDSVTVTPNATVDVWAEFKNAGTETWKADSLRLVTTPSSRTSTLADSSWVNATTVGTLSTDVPANDVARFEWKLKAQATEGTLTEAFALVDASGTVVAGTSLHLAVNIATPTTVAQTQSDPTQKDIQAAEPTRNEPAPTVISNPAGADFFSRMLNFFNDFYLAAFFFLGIALLLNIGIKLRIQHPHVIGQTMAVIAIAATAILLKGHFLEKIGQTIRVL
ncbi:MAG: CAP domain-containing protein [Patescibacteria group bacterium]|jgi:hypothetical protein